MHQISTKPALVFVLFIVISSPCFAATNLLVNGGAEIGDFTGWTITANGGSGWTVGYSPVLEGSRSFVSSFAWDTMQQDINLTALGYPDAVLDSSPSITFRDYMTGIRCNPNVKDTYHIEVYLFNSTGDTVASYSTGTLQAEWDGVWTQANYTFTNYSAGVRAIRVVQSGFDGGFCAGQYGTTFDNASVYFEDIPVSNCSTPLNLSKMTYKLNQSIAINGSTCLTVSAANVTLDCNGFSITGNNSNNNGIYSNQFNTMIKNCNISNFAIGVYFDNATDGLIQNNTITNTYDGGAAIRFEANPSSDRNTLFQNTITAGNSSGITIWNGQNNTIDCNGANMTGGNYSGTFGIYSQGNYTVVKNCNIDNFMGGISFVDVSYGSIANNSIHSSYDDWSGNSIYIGANIYGALFNNVTNCTGNSTGGDSTKGGSGLYVGGGPQYTTILNFTGYSYGGNSGGIKIAIDTSNNQVINSHCYSVLGDGIYISSGGLFIWTNSHNNSVINSTGFSINGAGINSQNWNRNNTIINSNGTSINSYGIKIFKSPNTQAINSIGISNTSYGIYVSGDGAGNESDNNTIVNCTAHSNSSDGMHVNYATNAHIYNNNISDNPGYSMSISNTVNATISGNTFQNDNITLYSSHSSGLNISNNLFNNTTMFGIIATNTSDSTIQNNTFTNSGRAALGFLWLGNVTYLKVNGTTCNSGGITFYLHDMFSGAFDMVSSNGTVLGVLNSGTNYGMACLDFSATPLGLGNTTMVYAQDTLPPGINCTFWSNNSLPCLFSANDVLIPNGSGQSFIFNSSAIPSGINVSIFGSAPAIDYGGSSPTGYSSIFLGYAPLISYNINVTQNTFQSDWGLRTDYATGNIWWNTFNDSLAYAKDTYSSFNFSPVINGQAEGNLWANVINGSVAISGVNNSTGFPALYIGGHGSGYPYSSATSGMVRGMTDYAPLTPNKYSNVNGNGSSINASNSSYTNITVSINGNTSVNGTYDEGVLLVNITDSNLPILEFNFNFTNATMNFSNVAISANTTGGRAYASVSGFDSSHIMGGKTLYIYNVSPSYLYVCIRDEDGIAYTDISSTCAVHATEHIVACNGTNQSGYTCTNISATTLKLTGLNHSAAIQFSPPAAQIYGGSDYLTPSLSYSFNCSSSLLLVTAKSSGTPINRLTVYLKDPAQTGYLASATTDSSGIAAFAINESKRYSLESAQTSGYSQAYLPAFLLTLCPPSPVAQQNGTQPAAPACSSYSYENCPSSCVVCPPCEACSSISCQTEEYCASIGFNRSWYESVKPKAPVEPSIPSETPAKPGKDASQTQQSGKPGAQTAGTGAAQSSQPDSQSALQTAAAPALSLAAVGGIGLLALAVVAGIGYYLFTKKKKRL